MRRTARSVVDVIAGEAGYSLSAMKDVASAIYNRAKELGVSPEDVVSVKSEFNAYGGPVASSAKRAMAAKAFAAVMADGPTHKGTFYAQPGSVKNLPKGLTEVKVGADRHHYFVDPKNRAIKTAAGFKTPNPKNAVAVRGNLPASVNTLPSPSPMRDIPAGAANNLASASALGSRDFISSNMARVAKAAGTAFTPMAGTRPGFIGGATANSLQRGPIGAGLLSPQSAGLGFMPSSSAAASTFPGRPEHISPNTLSANSRVASAQNTFSRMHPSTQEDAVSHLMDNTLGAQAFGAQAANAFASLADAAKAAPRTAAPGVTVGQNDPRMAKELDRQMLAGLPAGQTDTQMPPDPAAEQADIAAFAAVPSYAKPTAFAALDRPAPIDPNYAPPTTLAAVSGLPKIGTVDEPAPPLSQPTTRRVASVPSARRSTMRTASVQKQPTDPLAGRTLAGVRPTERFSVNSVNEAMSGRRGATAYSRSMPGVAVISRGTNMGPALHNLKTGATTLYSLSGNITRVKFDTPGGFFGHLGDSLGGGTNSLGGASGGGFGIGGRGSTRTGNSR